MLTVPEKALVVAVALVLDGARPAPRYLAHCGAVLVLAIDAGIYRLGMLELAIAMHGLRGTEPTGTPGAARVQE